MGIKTFFHTLWPALLCAALLMAFLDASRNAQFVWSTVIFFFVVYAQKKNAKPV